MNQDHDQALREQLISLLDGGNAHVPLDDFIKGFPVEKCGQRVPGLPYTAWQVLEHMRICQWDILEFSRDANHVSPESEKAYWPAHDKAGSKQLWDDTVAGFRKDMNAFRDLLNDPANDLFARIPHGSGQTLLREALVLADHNSNHLGTLITIGRIVQQ